MSSTPSGLNYFVCFTRTVTFLGQSKPPNVMEKLPGKVRNILFFLESITERVGVQNEYMR